MSNSPEPSAVGERADAALIPVGQELGGIESVARRINLPNREHAPMAAVMLRRRACWHGIDRGMLNGLGLLATGYSDGACCQRNAARPEQAAA